MGIGRIEVYLHSDATTAHKGGAMIRVTAQSDFGARTTEFIEFCRHAAQLAYAAQADSWEAVIAVYPDAEINRAALAEILHERVIIDRILRLQI
jgi:translation elongation factor EF-Ts